ncbi:YheC/YheD family protein [Alteribacter keqinensis]|uniref:YheC/YheD family protein n=1 Tax=Alteribacter keqinensis TaxID=2483800 RepID=A0A3M7TW96_9BACI|nr:YheC/YheD family protein [Alteribacter keqinensis]RNA68685.1 YheC/YheD family protein [Alteribacter keqinensis]
MTNIISEWIISPHQTETVYVPHSFLKQTSFYDGAFVTFLFGTKERHVKIRESAAEDWVISQDLKDELYLPHTGPYGVHFDEHTIAIGPHIGIYTAGFTQSLLRPVGERSFLFAKYITAAKKLGVSCFLFGASHIKWEEGLVEGFFWNEKGWEKIITPLPNVVYDRIPNRKTESHPGYAQVRERLQNEYAIPWFNPGFFDKWLIHKALTDSRVDHYLPESTLSPDVQTLLEYLKEHKQIYIKPANGSLGIGIHQIIYVPEENMFYCRFRDRERNRLRRYSSLQRLVKKQFPAGLSQMVVQKGIDLLSYQHKPIDFRIHTNKNAQGIWQVSAFAAKVAGIGSVTTHVNSGGQIKSLSELKEDFVLSEKVYLDLKKAAIVLSESIDEQIEGCIGEIGFDFGVDKNEKIWMFEANSKPGRSIFSHPRLKKEEALTRHLPFQFGIYLFDQLMRSSPVYIR